MTHQGEKVTFASAFPTLLRLKAGSERLNLRMMIGCRGAEKLHPVPEHIAENTPDLAWSHCPFDLLDSPFAQAVRELDRLARVAPLSDWPRGYAFWAVAGLMTLRGAS